MDNPPLDAISHFVGGLVALAKSGLDEGSHVLTLSCQGVEVDYDTLHECRLVLVRVEDVLLCLGLSGGAPIRTDG